MQTYPHLLPPLPIPPDVETLLTNLPLHLHGRWIVLIPRHPHLLSLVESPFPPYQFIRHKLLHQILRARVENVEECFLAEAGDPLMQGLHVRDTVAGWERVIGIERETSVGGGVEDAGELRVERLGRGQVEAKRGEVVTLGG